MSSLVHYPWMQGGERRSGPKEGEKVWGLGGGGGLGTSGRYCRCPLSCNCIMECVTLTLGLHCTLLEHT